MLSTKLLASQGLGWGSCLLAVLLPLLAVVFGSWGLRDDELLEAVWKGGREELPVPMARTPESASLLSHAGSTACLLVPRWCSSTACLSRSSSAFPCISPPQCLYPVWPLAHLMGTNAQQWRAAFFVPASPFEVPNRNRADNKVTQLTICKQISKVSFL